MQDLPVMTDGTLAPTTPDAASAPPPARGTPVDRFIVLGQLGAGGMGVVLSAFDPDLERKVALKLLRSDSFRDAASVGRTRLVAEAQAMARLAHPNVVAGARDRLRRRRRLRRHGAGRRDHAARLAARAPSALARDRGDVPRRRRRAGGGAPRRCRAP